MDVGKEVRRMREAKGWSQAKLAGASDMGVSGISQIETGARNPSVVTLTKIAEALGVEVTDLFPKGSHSSPEPSLFNGLEGERRSSRFAEALFATANKCVGTMTAASTDPKTAAGMVDALLTLYEFVMAPLNDDQRRQSLTDEEGEEIFVVAESILEAASAGVQRLEEVADDVGQEEEARRRRKHIREMTRRISA